MKMKKSIKLNNNPLWLIKESSKDRLNRVKTQRSMKTLIEKDKRKYSRKTKYKEILNDND